MSKGKKIFLGVIICVVFLGIISSMGSKKSVAKSLDNDPDFKYSTSLTSNYDTSDKAKVYLSDMSVPEAAQYIMNKNKPEDYTDLDNEEAIQLTYDDYYVLIYKSEDGKTYTQISSRKYIHNNGYYGLYRPYGHNIVLFYNTAYTSSRYYTKDNYRYGNGYYSSVNNLNTSSSTNKTNTSKTNTSNTKSTTNTKDNDSTKIKTDKNASSKIRTNSSKSNSTGTNSNSAGTKTNSTGTSSNSTSTKSVRSGSVGTKSRVGGGTSFGK